MKHPLKIETMISRLDAAIIPNDSRQPHNEELAVVSLDLLRDCREALRTHLMTRADELAAALCDALAQLEYLDEKFQRTGSTAGVVARLRHVLNESTVDTEQPIHTAPRDGQMLWLWVKYPDVTRAPWVPLGDHMEGWTLGFNSFDHTGIDEWQFVGWHWSQDCFTDASAPEYGKPLRWRHTGIPGMDRLA